MKARLLSMRLRYLLCSGAILLGGGLVAAAEPIPKTHRAEIKPSLINLNPGETRRFKAIMTATRLKATSSGW